MPPTRQNNFVNTATEDQSKQVTPSDPFKTLGIIFLSFALLLSFATYGVLMYIENANVQTENNIKGIEMSLSGVPLDDMLLFYNKIKAINSVLSSHNYVSTGLNTLSDLVEENSYFKSYSYNIKEKDINLTVVGVTNNHAGVVRQLDNFKDDKYQKYIKSAELKNVETDEFNNITFTIDLKVNPLVSPDYILNSNQGNESDQVNFSTPGTSIVNNSTSTNNQNIR